MRNLRAIATTVLGGAVMAASAVAVWRACCEPPALEVPLEEPPARSEPEIRQALFDELQPVKLANCELLRFGEPSDGGYLMCGNLLDSVSAGYSYGINGFDGWGCDISRTLKVPVHEYDCFNIQQPACDADTRFHTECVGPITETVEGRLFDTIERQLRKNGDAGKRLVMKMDVEGAEWDSFMRTPDAVLDTIDQLVVEFHRTHEGRFLKTVEVLKRHFYVVNLHFNNHSCEPGLEPFPAWAYEVLFVNKKLGIVDPSVSAEVPHPRDTPNTRAVPDCQAIAH